MHLLLFIIILIREHTIGKVAQKTSLLHTFMHNKQIHIFQILMILSSTGTGI